MRSYSRGVAWHVCGVSWSCSCDRIDGVEGRGFSVEAGCCKMVVIHSLIQLSTVHQHNGLLHKRGASIISEVSGVDHHFLEKTLLYLFHAIKLLLYRSSISEFGYFFFFFFFSFSFPCCFAIPSMLVTASLLQE